MPEDNGTERRTLEQIWAPWRMQMIRAPKTGGCFMCEKHAQDNDRENLVLERSKYSYCLMNLYPYTNAHLLIVPYRHTGVFTELTDEETNDMMHLAKVWADVIKRSSNCEGLNIGMNVGRPAGAGCADHIHMHIVPRWNGDTNFMTVFGDVRVINQALEDTWAELKKTREELEK